MNVAFIGLVIMVLIMLQIGVVIFGNVGSLCDNLPVINPRTTATYKEQIRLTEVGEIVGIELVGDKIWALWGENAVFLSILYGTDYLLDGVADWQQEGVRINVSDIHAFANYLNNTLYITDPLDANNQIWLSKNGLANNDVSIYTSSVIMKGVGATDDHVFISFYNGTILRGDINYTTNALTNVEKFGDTGLNSLTRISIHDDHELFVVDEIPGNIYLYDAETGLNDRQVIDLGLSDISGMGTSEDYLVLSFNNTSGLISIYDKHLSNDNGWKHACDNSQEQSQLAYGILALVGIIIAVVAIIGFVRYL